MILFNKKSQNNDSEPRVIYINSLDTKKRARVAPFIFQLLLMYVGLVGFLYSVSTSLKMTMEPYIIALMVLPLLVTAALFTLSSKLYVSFISVFGGLVFIILVFVRKLAKYIFDAFVFCYNYTIHLVVEEGFSDYERAFTEDITEKLADPKLVQGYLKCVIIVLAVVFSVIFVSTLMKKSMIWVCAVCCFAVLTPSLYYGAVPSGIAFAMFLSGIIGCYAESISYKIYKKAKKENQSLEDTNKKNQKANRLGFAFNSAASGFFTTCAVLAISFTVSVSVYSKDILQIDSIREFIDSFAQRFLNQFFYESFETSEGAIGGLLEGNILTLDTPNFRDLPVMTVTTKTNTSLYLRGWIGQTLEQDGWEILDDNDTDLYFSRIGPYFDSYTQFYDYTNLMYKDLLASASTDSETKQFGFVHDTVKVKAKYSKSLMMFMPIAGTDGEVKGKYDGIEVIGDTISFFKNDRPKNNTYTINAALLTYSNRDFYLNYKQNLSDYMFMAEAVLQKDTALNEEEQFMYDERKYSDYVNENYLIVPSNADFLAEIADEVTKNYNADFDKALAIERYFKTQYKYSKKPVKAIGSALSKVRYMVEETQTGYCTYFATAMTVMMRQLGIPSRYVIGYHAMTTEDTGANSYVRDIKDDNYHAWVEVYFDGIGWLTFDPTPGVVGQNVIRDYAYLDDPAYDASTDPDQPGEKDTFQGGLIDQIEPDEQPTEEPLGSLDDLENIGNDIPKWLIAIIIIVDILLLLIAALIVAIILIKQKFKNYVIDLKRLEPTEMTKIIYPQILRLFGSLKYKPRPGELITDFAKRLDKIFTLSIPFKSIVNDLEMSQFSNNTISAESAERIYEYYNLLSKSVFYSLNIFKKYYFMVTIRKKKYLNEKI